MPLNRCNKALHHQNGCERSQTGASAEWEFHFFKRNNSMRNSAYIDAVRENDSASVGIVCEGAVSERRRLIAKRTFDIALASPLCLMALPLLIVLGILVRLTSRGPAIYWSIRVGRDNRIFRMPKLRSMHHGAPEVATHLFTSAHRFLTPIGQFLRRTSLDELPQLFSILAGDLSFTGPRPALFNQNDLIEMRTSLGIHKLTPGLTGWAQVNGRDHLTLEEKVLFDAEYLRRQSFLFDLLILGRTLRKVLLHEGISH